MKKETNISDARSRILEAAGEIFAEYGFRKATIRDICGKAGVNLAAVNYYFRGKENLYLETLRTVMADSLQKYPPDFGAAGESDPIIRLHAFIRSFLLRVLDKGRPSWFGKILAREFIDPTSILDAFMKETFYPNFLILNSIVGNIIGKEAGSDIVHLCSASIIAQCLYFGNPKSTYTTFKQSIFDSQKIEDIASHITHFSLEALRSIYNEGKKQ
jgi:AcrR family transcriptional regulator